MPDAAYVLLGVAFGIVAGVYLASRHSHRLKNLVEDEKRLAARAVRSATDQLSTRLEQREQELVQLQSQAGVLKSELQSTTEDAFRELAQFHDVGTSLERVIDSYTQLMETVESRLLAINARLRKLGIATAPGANAGSSNEPETKTIENQPADVPRVEYRRVNR